MIVLNYIWDGVILSYIGAAIYALIEIEEELMSCFYNLAELTFLQQEYNRTFSQYLHKT